MSLACGSGSHRKTEHRDRQGTLPWLASRAAARCPPGPFPSVYPAGITALIHAWVPPPPLRAQPPAAFHVTLGDEETEQRACDPRSADNGGSRSCYCAPARQQAPAGLPTTPALQVRKSRFREGKGSPGSARPRALPRAPHGHLAAGESNWDALCDLLQAGPQLGPTLRCQSPAHRCRGRCPMGSGQETRSGSLAPVYTPGGRASEVETWPGLREAGLRPRGLSAHSGDGQGGRWVRAGGRAGRGRDAGPGATTGPRFAS